MTTPIQTPEEFIAAIHGSPDAEGAFVLTEEVRARDAAIRSAAIEEACHTLTNLLDHALAAAYGKRNRMKSDQILAEARKAMGVSR